MNQKLVDEAAVLACSVYVDLNRIRLGIAGTPETSEHTSIKMRIDARQDYQCFKRLAEEAPERVETESPDGRQPEHEESGIWLTPIPIHSPYPQPRPGTFHMSLDHYIELVDWTGRMVRSNKRGSIPAHLRPILERLEIDVDNWIEVVLGFGRLFKTIVGKAKDLAAEAARRGRRFVKGLGQACRFYRELSPPVPKDG